MSHSINIRSFLDSRYWLPFNEEMLAKDILRDDLYTFQSKEDLIGYVKNQTKYSDLNQEIVFALNSKEQTILVTISQTLEKVFETLQPKGVQTILLLPTADNFVIESMDGVVGYSPHKDVMFLYVAKDFKEEALIETVAHEYNHTQYFHTTKIHSVLDGLIAEGFAEHFRLQTVGGKIAKWCLALDKKKSFELLEKLEKDKVLSETDYKVYSDIFINPKSEYPHWAGYSIGYNLIEQLKSQEEISWNEILQEQPKKVFDKIKWTPRQINI
jgi:uncharacterized protein YjaZ